MKRWTEYGMLYKRMLGIWSDRVKRDSVIRSDGRD